MKKPILMYVAMIVLIGACIFTSATAQDQNINTKTFPLNENTLNDVQEIISDLLPDIINFQEIWDYNTYQYLSSALEAYEFILSSESLLLTKA